MGAAIDEEESVSGAVIEAVANSKRTASFSDCPSS